MVVSCAAAHAPQPPSRPSALDSPGSGRPWTRGAHSSWAALRPTGKAEAPPPPPPPLAAARAAANASLTSQGSGHVPREGRASNVGGSEGMEGVVGSWTSEVLPVSRYPGGGGLLHGASGG